MLLNLIKKLPITRGHKVTKSKNQFKGFTFLLLAITTTFMWKLGLFCPLSHHTIGGNRVSYRSTPAGNLGGLGETKGKERHRGRDGTLFPLTSSQWWIRSEEKRSPNVSDFLFSFVIFVVWLACSTCDVVDCLFALRKRQNILFIALNSWCHFTNMCFVSWLACRGKAGVSDSHSFHS